MAREGPPATSPPGRSEGDRVAVYPGSFDPLTYGHLDILWRALALFERVIVAILNNPGKQALFTPRERAAMIETEVKGQGEVTVEVFDGLLVDYAESRRASVILRGVRAFSDFEYEFQMALMNRKLNPRIETVFLMPNQAYSFVSSRLVKEVATLGGDLSGVVPPAIETRLKERLGVGKASG